MKDRYFKMTWTQTDPYCYEMILKVPEGVEFSKSNLEEKNRNEFKHLWDQWLEMYYERILVMREGQFSISLEELDSERGSKEWDKEQNPELDSDGVVRWEEK